MSDLLTTPTVGALAGWRVLELADGRGASYCGKLLSDLGADVVKVEPPGGHPARRWEPRDPEAADDETGAAFRYLNTGKSSVVVSDGYAGLEQLQSLISRCDVLITDCPSWFDHAAVQPSSSVVVVTPFGVTGPHAGYRGNHLVTFHSGGEGSILPSGPGWREFPTRPPIQVGANLADYDAGWNAAGAALAVMYDRLRTGLGQRVDVSQQESELTLNRTRLSRFNNDGVVLRREAGRYGYMGMMRCADGWVQLVGMTPEQWDKLAASPDAGGLADPAIATAAARADRPDEAAAAIQAWCAARAKAEVVGILAPLGAPIGAYATPADLLASEQLADRRFWRELEGGPDRPLVLPGPPFQLSGTPMQIRDAPALGSANGFSAPDGLKPQLPPGRGLEGVKILDFTWAAAGPYGTCLLALLGAEVIKVESLRRPDPARRGFLADYGGIDRSPNFNELNLNKRSFQVDLTQEAGRALVHRLVGWADVVVDNFRPGVMTRFGLDASSLRAERPGLIVAASSANGSTGPEAMAAGLASIFGATGGLSEQTGYPDGPPSEVGESTDYRSGAALTVAVLAALLHRARTGEGQAIDLASQEVVIASTPDALLALQVGADWPIRVGNGDREHSPHGVYPARGEDDWVAIAVVDEPAWAGLCSVLDRSDWTDLLPTAQARRANAAEIDAEITAWSKRRPAADSAAQLQAAGVPASAVMTNEALATDPHLAARAVFQTVEHPVIGAVKVMRQPWVFSDLPVEIRPGPRLGQHNEDVLDLLGLSATERNDLDGVLR